MPHKRVIVNVSKYLKRLISGDHAVSGTAASLRNVVVWVFIALVAGFLTHPAGAPAPGSAFDAPVPWPAELGVDSSLGIK
jgi:hypothetical protein